MSVSEELASECLSTKDHEPVAAAHGQCQDLCNALL